jgi:predicted secreted protein
MKNIPIMTCVLLGTILIAVLAEAGVTVLQMQDNGKEIRVKIGEVIELALEEQAGTGYKWEFDRLDEKHFQVVHTETKSLADRNMVGGPMLQVWRLKTIGPGDATLSLDYLRPWEGRAKAVNHFEVKVHIH